MSEAITFELDGVTVEARPGESIWQVAERLGTDIPHLCWQPKPDYRADGNCRACMVEVDGERVLAASCIRTPTEGMKVRTSSERARKARELVFELLAATAEAEGIPYSIEAASRDTRTDAEAIYNAHRGVATALVSVPNRYMHSPNEMIALEDLERTARLLAAFARRLTPETDFVPR